MILLNGMLTDANLPGVEKVCVTMVHSSWLEVPMHKVSKEDIGYEGDLAGPGCTFMVKGIWIPWKAELTNTVPLLRLLVNRIEKDWVALPVKQLSQQLLQTTWQQCQLQVDADMMKLKDWQKEFHLYAQQQVQQRGVGATVNIIKRLISGVAKEPQNLLVVDLLPSRFAEWSLACWEIQQAFLLDEDSSLNVRFLGVYHDDNAKDLSTSCDALAGKALSGFWDKSDKAGPKSRASSPFHRELPTLECLAIVEGEIKLFARVRHPNLKDLMARINDDTEIVQAVKSFHGGATRPSSSATPATETRTLANPEWNGDGPPNVRSKLALTAVTTSAFESSTTWLGWSLQQTLAEFQVSTDGTNRSLQYRYVVTPSTMVNAFKGKDLVKEQHNVNKFRAPQLGALFNGRLSQLPRGKNASIVWEVKVDESVPAVLTPLKPKYYLLGTASIKDGHAVKLG
ncbi:unnamed protein product [Durusdinium trenchii]|uniref:Uncharacterized protein n=2 Tax=Durusdinium trenchii TaxID=1381693 RepID=A0ABP0PYT3_9DINO